MEKKNSGKIIDLCIQVIVLIAALVTIAAVFIELVKPRTPQFIIETPVVKVGEQIIIKAANRKANRNEPLNVEFDKHVFENAGEPFKNDNDNKQRWRFNIKNVDFTPEMIKPGAHQMRFGFKEEDLCKEEQAVSFSFKRKTPPSDPPVPRSANIAGFYKAPVDDEFGSKDIITLTIERVDRNSTIPSFKYILAGIEGIDSGTGNLNFSQRTIYIPRLGQGKVSLNRENKFIFNFIFKDREVQFVQSNI